MKRLISIFLALSLVTSAMAQKLTFMPQWTPQAQFAGFYMAQEMGFYAQEGLDVEILHIKANSTESILTQLVSGKVQIAGQQLLQSIIARSDGQKILNVMQITQKSGLWCVSHTPVSKPEDLQGMKIGKWKSGYSEFCDMLETYNNLHINWVPFINGINLYVYGAVDATLCYSFSEYIALQLAIGDIPDNQVLKFSDFGYECPEDGLYVTEEYYAQNKDAVDKFVRASKKGWEYARTHKKQTLEVVMRICSENHIVTNRAMQERMLDNYISLQTNPATGKIDFAPVTLSVYNDVTKALLETGYIVNKPEYKEVIR
ncbi:MAG: ABC transporter substrate-binding protein [Bacteroidales bacterium]|nr:ABC transporter substrate-binding protein [Bacteroidales bacterium]